MSCVVKSEQVKLYNDLEVLRIHNCSLPLPRQMERDKKVLSCHYLYIN